MGEHLYTYDNPPNKRHLQQIGEVLQRNGVIAISTGTSWAFCVDPASKKAITRLTQLKPGHPTNVPFSLLCRDISMATQVTVIDGGAFRVLNRVWPGPFTVLLASHQKLPRLLRTKRSVVGVRIPDEPLAMAIVDQFGGPLLVSSVPRTAAGSLPTMGYEVYEAFGNRIDLVVDLGAELPGVETTVIDMVHGTPEVIREGAGDLGLI